MASKKTVKATAKTKKKQRLNREAVAVSMATAHGAISEQWETFRRPRHRIAPRAAPRAAPHALTDADKQLSRSIAHQVRATGLPGALNLMAVFAEKNAVAHGFRRAGRCEDQESVAVFVANEHSEISELWTAYREGKLGASCDKAPRLRALGLPVLTCAEEELADVILRALDTARALGADIGKAVLTKHAYNVTRPRRHGDKRA